jgi:hypothetical protein
VRYTLAVCVDAQRGAQKANPQSAHQRVSSHRRLERRIYPIERLNDISSPAATLPLSTFHFHPLDPPPPRGLTSPTYPRTRNSRLPNTPLHLTSSRLASPRLNTLPSCPQQHPVPPPRATSAATRARLVSPCHCIRSSTAAQNAPASCATSKPRHPHPHPL